MKTVSVSPKGQITLPKEIRRAAGIEPGTRVLLVVGQDRRLSVEPIPAQSLSQLAGSLRVPAGVEVPGPEELRRLTKQRAVKRHQREQ